MATRLSKEVLRGLSALRYEPTQKRIRALAGGRTLVDSRRAMLVYEPKRFLPCYAVPDEDIAAKLVPTVLAEAAMHPVSIAADGPPVLDPRTAFAAHTCPGDALSVEADGVTLDGAGFRPADPDLNGYVVLDFTAFDWLEEDEPIIAHPRDPFHRIDVRRSSSHVRIELDGVVLAESTSARLLFEAMIAARFYLPREDVRMDLLTPSPTRSACAYKGVASYWSAQVNGRSYPDLAWTYEEPLADATEVVRHLAFFDEHVDVYLDGELRPRPVTPWS